MALILIMVLWVLIMLLVRNHEQSAESASKIYNEVVAVKQCPPHKWNYVEVKDTNGDTVKWKIVCDICGPMQTQERPRGGDYS